MKKYKYKDCRIKFNQTEADELDRLRKELDQRTLAKTIKQIVGEYQSLKDRLVFLEQANDELGKLNQSLLDVIQIKRAQMEKD